MITVADIDIDFADRNSILEGLVHIPASIIKNAEIKRHNTGIYFQDIPIDPISNLASLDHEEAKQYGYFKLDFLNLSIYKNIKNEEHLNLLMNTDPIWEMLEEKEIVDELFHLSGNFDIVKIMKPRTIEELSMVLAIKIPCKRYLIGKTWNDVKKEIWLPDPQGGFQFKKSHSIVYAAVVIVQMNLLIESLDV